MSEGDGVAQSVVCSYLEIAELCESFGTPFKSAGEGLYSFMHDPVGLDIATLGKFSAAMFT